MITTDGHVLVVEDNAALRSIIAEALDEDGYSVSIADNGRSALDIARQSPPDLVILDLMMPHMNGEQFCSAIRELSGLESRPIIVVSAAQGTAEVGERLGAAASLNKPFDLFELTDLVGALLA